ncbi:MAG: septal ring lytic transglycosylase RlpA family protein [Myxococcota bacterium]
MTKLMIRLTSIYLVFGIMGISCATQYYQKGKASFYGAKGGKTASGEKVNPKALTAAHKKLPFNTIVEVINLRNKKTVKVRINDRGPYIKGRIIDLTPAAFKKLDNPKRGVIPVKIRIIKKGSGKRKKKNSKIKKMGPFGPGKPGWED